MGRTTTPSESQPLKRNAVWRAIQAPLDLFCRTWVRLRVSGAEHLTDDSGGLLLMNHQSFLDPLVVGVRLKRPVSFLARDSLFKVPVVGWVLRNTYVMPISRESARSGAIREAIARLRAGFLVGLFPEGTRCAPGGEVGPFRPGFVAIVRRARVPVYPVGIAGADRVMPRGRWFIRPRRIEVVIGPPLERETVEQLGRENEHDALVELIRTRVVACHDQAAERLQHG